MEYKRNHVINICLALIVASAIILLSRSSFFRRLEFLSQDFLFQLKPAPARQSPEIIIIEITDDEIKNIGRWPWERDWLLKMTDALIDFQVGQVAYDFIMVAKSDEAVDAKLAAAIARAGNVYLPSFWRMNRKGEREAVEPIPVFARSAKGTGFVNIAADLDGVYRRIPLYTDEESGLHYNLILQMVTDRLGLKVSAVNRDWLELSGPGEEIRIPMAGGNNMLLSWYGKWEHSFRRYSFLDVLQAHEDFAAGRKPALDTAALKDSLCIVSLTATGLYDIKAIPLQPQYPGAGIVATALANIFDRAFIRPLPDWFSALFIYLIALVPPFLILQERPVKETLNLGAGLFVFGFVYVLFLKGYSLPLAGPLLALSGSYVAVTTYNFTTYRTLLKKIEAAREANLLLQQKYQGLKDDLALTEKEKQELERANRALDQFVQTVTHDIRSPLMGIIGYTDQLQARIEDSLDEKDKGLFDGIFRSIDRLNTMIDDMLKSTRLSHVKSPYERVDIDRLARQTVGRLEFQIQQSGAKVVVEPGLPEVICDRIKMTAIFHNLVGNALKFSSKNTDTPRVEISSTDKGEFYEFCVRDNGIGIAPGDQEAVFELHKRVGPSDEYDGKGVGLSIVKKFVEDHGGHVRVDSALEQGAAFFFTIPKNLSA